MEEKEEEEKVEGGRWVKRREVSSGALDIPVVQDFQGGPSEPPPPWVRMGPGVGVGVCACGVRVRVSVVGGFPYSVLY